MDNNSKNGNNQKEPKRGNITVFVITMIFHINLCHGHELTAEPDELRKSCRTASLTTCWKMVR